MSQLQYIKVVVPIYQCNLFHIYDPCYFLYFLFFRERACVFFFLTVNIHYIICLGRRRQIKNDMSSQNDTNASIFFNCTQAMHKPTTNRQTNQTKVTKLTTTTTKQCQHKAHNASTTRRAKYAVKKNNNASPLKIITEVYSNLPSQPALTVCSDFPVSRF